MAAQKVNITNNPDDQRHSAPAIKACPMCDGEMEVVYSRNAQQVVVCKDCHTGVTVPASAWNVAHVKREAKWVPKV
jgi:ssDNA-binding Zn-finger/Zn-ribbon topoisomerase 1